MPDIDVILAKVSNIQRCLKRIKETTNLNPDRTSLLINNLNAVTKAYKEGKS